MADGYRPTDRVAEILKWTLEKVRSVPYRVPTRWAFYRCVQEIGLAKEDYGVFKKWTSRARKRFWSGWTPYTLVDDTRKILPYGRGFPSFDEWFETIKKERPVYEKFSGQKNLVTVWFEAEAMCSQFKHYTEPYKLPLVPFRGDPGPYFKWQIAEFLGELALKYPGKPIVVLYFGDYEPLSKSGSRGKGIRIPHDALRDIRPWFEALWLKENEGSKTVPAINLVRCGLNPEHIKRFGLPENPQRPGEYQWEAVPDERARELIVGSIERYWDLDAVRNIEHRETRDANRWRKMLAGLNPATTPPQR